jgi:glutamate synthase (ferredoxin)
MTSETGAIPDSDEADIVEKGRLGPGRMISVDLSTGEFKDNIKIKSEIASRHPYGEWIAKNRKDVKKMDASPDRIYDDATTSFCRIWLVLLRKQHTPCETMSLRLSSQLALIDLQLL